MDKVLGPDSNTEEPSASPIVLVHSRNEEADCKLKKLDDHMIERLGVMKQGKHEYNSETLERDRG